MGEVIRKNAAVDDIIADVRIAYTRAKAKQGKWHEIAEERLAPIVKLIDTIVAQLDDATKTAEPLLAALDAEDDKADRLIGKVSDDIWNAIGRPASDAWFSILFPGGNAFYVEGDVNEQPDKMDLLIQLLKAGVHPKLPADKADAAAAEVKASAAELRAAVKAARGPRTKVLLLERVKDAVARAAAIELSSFKRVLKANGFSEAEIHTVLPDRSRPAPKKPAEPVKPEEPKPPTL